MNVQRGENVILMKLVYFIWMTLLFAWTREQMSVLNIKTDVDMIKPGRWVGPPSRRPSNHPLSQPFSKPEGKHIDECGTP